MSPIIELPESQIRGILLNPDINSSQIIVARGNGTDKRVLYCNEAQIPILKKMGVIFPKPQPKK